MKIYLDTIGCRLNQAEIEKFAGQFHAAGHQIVASAGEADLAVINTCTVTSQAASDSRQKVRQFWKAGCRRIIPTGCLSTLEGDALLTLEGVDVVIGNSGKDHLVNYVLRTISGKERFTIRQQVEGSRKRTRAFIKAQDGCDQHCAYCITRYARGKSRSVMIGDIIADIRAAENAGAKEAVLSGVQLGSWGRDHIPATDIVQLVKRVLDETEIPRIRLSSIEPWDLPDGFYLLWENPRLCRQLHLPLQSGSAITLKRMGRLNTPGSFREIVEKARMVEPDLAVTTDIIVGFPGENEEEFSESIDFVEKMVFAGGHVFPYSSRVGTPSELLPGKIDPQVKKARAYMMRSAFEKARINFQLGFLGKTVEVLWEKCEPGNDNNWILSGLSGNYFRVTTNSTIPLQNEISMVKLLKCMPNEISGIIE